MARLEANRSMGGTSQSIDVDAILRGGMGPDDIAKLNADRSMGGMTQPIDVDAILRRGMPTPPAAAAPAITKPGAKGKIAAIKNKPAAVTPEEAAAAADIEAMKGFKPSTPLGGSPPVVAAATPPAPTGQKSLVSTTTTPATSPFAGMTEAEKAAYQAEIDALLASFA